MLPGRGEESRCTRLHNCLSLTSIIQSFGGAPPEDEFENIRRHLCQGGNVCIRLGFV